MTLSRTLLKTITTVQHVKCR